MIYVAMKRNRRLWICVVVFATAALAWPVDAQEELLPQTLVGFLKPQAKVSVGMGANGSVSLLVFTPEGYKVAKEPEDVTLDQLVAKYPSVARRVQQAKEFVKREHGVDNVSVGMDRFRYCIGTVVAIGKDYLLVDMEGMERRRRVIATRAITKLSIDNPGLGLLANVNGRDVFFNRY